MFGMKGFHVSASGAIQGHHGPLVFKINRVQAVDDIDKLCKFHENPAKNADCISQWRDRGPSWPSCLVGFYYKYTN